MKKNGLRRSGLGRRILLFMLLTALGMGTIVFTVAFLEMDRMYDAAVTSNRDLEIKAAQDCGEALLTETQQLLAVMVSEQAENCSLVFERVDQEMLMLSGMMHDIYSHPDSFHGSIPPNPKDTPAGQAMGRGFIAAGVEVTEELLTEQRLMACIESAAAAAYANEDLLRCVLAGTESGLFYRYSDYNDCLDDYDPRTRSWYQKALEQPDKIVWTEAYYESYGVRVVTVSTTFRDGEGKIAGVIAADVTVQSLTENVLRMDDSGSFTFILDGNGSLIAAPESVAQDYFDNAERAEAIQDVLSGDTGITAVEADDGEQYLAYAPIQDTGWIFCISVPFDAVTAVATQTVYGITDTAAEALASMRTIMSQLRVQYEVVVFLCAAVVCCIAFVLTNMIRNPINRLTDGVRRMGAGDLNARISVRGDDEIAELGRAFNKMQDDLQKYIADLTKVMEEKHRVSAELNVARDIQQNMLPAVFPPFPDRDEFEIYASMTPAKEVGGDFYDLFMLDRNRLAMVIADVSDKGVPAALFMVVAKTLIKNQAQTCDSVAQILERVNAELCENNAAGMFVTLWMGIVDISTGHMHCANAGHEYPMLYTPGGSFEVLKDKHGVPLGCMEGVHYREYELDIEKGGILFVYTDGVAEAQNAAGELFGLERTLEALNRDPGASAQELLKHVRQAVDDFAGDAPQFDDMTMLCWKRNGCSCPENNG